MTHTKGKWFIVDDDDLLDEGQQDKIIIQSEKGYTIAECPYMDDYKNEMNANARLIASAPDLLEACEFVIKQAGLSSNSPSYIKLQQAIRKAKGE